MQPQGNAEDKNGKNHVYEFSQAFEKVSCTSFQKLKR